MRRKKRTLTPEERAELAEYEARSAETDRLLQERIAYHTARLKEKHGPDYEPPTLEEYEAQLRERMRERRAADGG